MRLLSQLILVIKGSVFEVIVGTCDALRTQKRQELLCGHEVLLQSIRAPGPVESRCLPVIGTHRHNGHLAVFHVVAHVLRVALHQASHHERRLFQLDPLPRRLQFGVGKD